LANQYSVIPAALTSTTPLVVVIDLIATEPATAAWAEADAAGLDAGAAGLVDPEAAGGLLLPQAASTTAAAARPGASHHRLRMALSPS
jgi:hypothetical protein